MKHHSSSWFLGVLALLTSFAFAAEPPPRPAAPAGPATPPPAQPAAPAGATAPTSPAPVAPARSNIDPPRIIVDDGQLKSHPFRVFITHHITRAMEPRLTFTGMHLITKPGTLEGRPLVPLHVLPRQWRTIHLDGTAIQAEGTLLVFDLTGHDIEWFKSAARLLPVVTWNEPGATANAPAEPRAIAGTDEIYLGNMAGAVRWTGALVGFVLLLLLVWSVVKAREITKFKPRPSLLLVTGPDGYLSLWRTQLMLWTFAVGGVVFLFGLLQLRVPDIPETLVALMGMSLLTGTISALKAQPKTTVSPAQPGAPAAAPGSVGPPPPVGAPIVPPNPPLAPAAPTVPAVAPVQTITFNPTRASWGDLISSWNKTTQQVELSVPKAQMVFWTAIILVLFVVKSVLLGALWPVPWELVALTGVSQAGYIGDKFVHSSAGT